MSSPSTFRMLRAMAWLRWRVLVNTITRSGARDIIERLSRTAESLLPVAIVVLLTPAAIGLAVLGISVGWLLPADALRAVFPLQILRWTLAVMLLLTLMGPLLLSTGQQAPGLVRLTLLPIPARVLYLAHTVAGLADPWVFLSVPVLAGVVAGGAARGAALTAIVALLAGLVFLLLLLGVAALASATLQLLVRNRRRAELLVLVGMLFVVVISLLPGALIPDDAGRRRGRRPQEALGRPLPGWVHTAASALPSEMYVRAMRQAAAGTAAPAAVSFAGLMAWAGLAHGLTWPVYQRLLRTPASSGRARRMSANGPLALWLPLAGPRTSAVAVSFVRLALRTPRGRAIVLMPIVMLAVFATIFVVRGNAIPIGPVEVGGGYSLGIFGIILALMSIGPFAFNQFAVDRAGLTLEFLSPISTRELLYGKAAGGALIASVPCALSIATGAVTGAHSLALWAAVVFGALAAYVLLSPVAASLSLLFPRAVDLSSVGNASNAHQAAGLLGVLAFTVACVPPVAIAVFALRALDSPLAAAGLLAGWLLIASALAFVGFRIAERLMDERRENLALVAAGR